MRVLKGRWKHRLFFMGDGAHLCAHRYQMTQEFSVRNGRANLSVTSGGGGPSIVMLHAGVADRRMWWDTQNHFSQNYSTISYDRRGFGGTIARDEPFSHVDDLRAVLDHYNQERYVLVGCSQGGRIAIDFALSFPKRVAALVLVSTAVTGAPSPSAYPTKIAQILTALAKAEEDNDIERVNAIEAHLWLDGPLSEEGRVAGASRDLFLKMNGTALVHPELTQENGPPSAMKRLNSITAPALLLHGSLDFRHVQERSAWLAGQIPQAQSIVMSGCAHLPNLERSGEFNEALGSFIEKVV